MSAPGSVVVAAESIETRGTLTIEQAVISVLRGEMSQWAGAKACGAARTTFTRRLQAHPDYDEARAAGLLAQQPDMTPVNAGDLKSHPAVVDVVVNGMPYRAAGEKYGLSAMTIHKWVMKAYPNYVGVRSRGRRPAKAPAAKPKEQTIHDEPRFVQLRKELAQLATDMGIAERDVAVALLAETLHGRE